LSIDLPKIERLRQWQPPTKSVVPTKPAEYRTGVHRFLTHSYDELIRLARETGFSVTRETVKQKVKTVTRYEAPEILDLVEAGRLKSPPTLIEKMGESIGKRTAHSLEGTR
jgi:hypothetical protein